MLKQIRKLCKPAYVYLVLSAITIILMMVQNAGASGTYKVGMYQCPCNNTAGIFLVKAIYVAFWTFILDAVCKAGYKSVSWFLVLFPMILGAVLVGLVLMSGGIREGINGDDDNATSDAQLDQATPLHAERDRLRTAYASIMLDEELFNEQGNKLIRFFQSFFEKLGSFLTGKGFQTERSRNLLKIKEKQKKMPKSETEDELDEMVADPSYRIKVDRKGNLTSMPVFTNDKLKYLEEKARDEERTRQVENKKYLNTYIPGLDTALKNTQRKQELERKKANIRFGPFFGVDYLPLSDYNSTGSKQQMYGEGRNGSNNTQERTSLPPKSDSAREYDDHLK